MIRPSERISQPASRKKLAELREQFRQWNAGMMPRRPQASGAKPRPS
jgi:hypothetical protein